MQTKREKKIKIFNDYLKKDFSEALEFLYFDCFGNNKKFVPTQTIILPDRFCVYYHGKFFCEVFELIDENNKRYWRLEFMPGRLYDTRNMFLGLFYFPVDYSTHIKLLVLSKSILFQFLDLEKKEVQLTF